MWLSRGLSPGSLGPGLRFCPVCFRSSGAWVVNSLAWESGIWHRNLQKEHVTVLYLGDRIRGFMPILELTHLLTVICWPRKHGAWRRPELCVKGKLLGAGDFCGEEKSCADQRQEQGHC